MRTKHRKRTPFIQILNINNIYHWCTTSSTRANVSALIFGQDPAMIHLDYGKIVPKPWQHVPVDDSSAMTLYESSRRYMYVLMALYIVMHEINLWKVMH